MVLLQSSFRGLFSCFLTHQWRRNLLAIARGSLRCNVYEQIKWVLCRENGGGITFGNFCMTWRLGAGFFSSLPYRGLPRSFLDDTLKLISWTRIPSGGIGTFGSLIVKSFGYTNFQSILFNLPFGAIQIVSILGGGWLATRFKMKGLVIVLFATLSAVGTIIMLVVPRDQKGVLLFGYYLVSWHVRELHYHTVVLILSRFQHLLLSRPWSTPGRHKTLPAIPSENLHQQLYLWECVLEM